MAYSRAELLQVVCAIAGRSPGFGGTWPEASDVVEEAAALLAEVDHKWEIYMGARAATERPAPASASPLCIHCGDDAESHAVDDEERRECMDPDCGCRQYECSKAAP